MADSRPFIGTVIFRVELIVALDVLVGDAYLALDLAVENLGFFQLRLDRDFIACQIHPIAGERCLEIFVGEPIVFLDLVDIAIDVVVRDANPGFTHLGFHEFVGDKLFQYVAIGRIDLLQARRSERFSTGDS